MKLLPTLAVPFLALGLTVAGCGKKNPEGTNPPGETGGSDVSAGGESGGGEAGGEKTGGEAGGEAGGENAGAEDGPDPNKVCDAEVSDTPTALFANNVLLRLPKGMEMIEENPFFARISSGNTESVCSGIITFGAIGYFQADPKKPVKQTRDETLKQRGLDPAEITWSDETEKGRDYSGSYSVPADEKGSPPIRGWFVLKEKAGTTFWYALETHPNAWNALGKTFQESGKRLLIVKK